MNVRYGVSLEVVLFLVNTVMNLRFPLSDGKFLSGRATIGL
jgi:hypothetical protein